MEGSRAVRDGSEGAVAPGKELHTEDAFVYNAFVPYAIRLFDEDYTLRTGSSKLELEFYKQR